MKLEAKMEMIEDAEYYDDEDHINKLPDELLLKVFSFLPDMALLACNEVSYRFNQLSNSHEVWKELYCSLYDYRLPLNHPAHAKFEFRELSRWREANPWKESHRQLRNGIHVMKEPLDMQRAENYKCFDQLEKALVYLDEEPDREKLIFVHSGTYEPVDTLHITTNVQIIGASNSNDITSSVLVESCRNTAVTFSYGSANAYFGFITVRYRADANARPAPISQQAQQPHCYALLVTDDGAQPFIERCDISSKVGNGAAVCVKKYAAPMVCLARSSSN